MQIWQGSEYASEFSCPFFDECYSVEKLSHFCRVKKIGTFLAVDQLRAAHHDPFENLAHILNI